jgi:hypothetical protein
MAVDQSILYIGIYTTLKRPTVTTMRSEPLLILICF